MKQPSFAGVFTALWTPTDGDGKLLSAEMNRHVAFLQGAGVNGLFVLGTTGEFLFLDHTQRRQVLEQAAAWVGRSPVIANVSDVRPAVVADLGCLARSLGLSAVALLPPFFYAVAPDDIVEFFVRAGEAIQLPLFLYNYPERAGNSITLDIIQAVADRVPVAGIKHSGGNLDYHRDLVALGRERHFVVFTGADTQLPAMMAMGVAGCVSGLANAVPELLVAQYQAIRQDNPTSLPDLSRRVAAIATQMERLSFPLNIAATITARGLPVGQGKTVLSPATRTRFDLVARELATLFAEWRLCPPGAKTA